MYLLCNVFPKFLHFLLVTKEFYHDFLNSLSRRFSVSSSNNSSTEMVFCSFLVSLFLMLRVLLFSLATAFQIFRFSLQTGSVFTLCCPHLCGQTLLFPFSAQVPFYSQSRWQPRHLFFRLRLPCCSPTLASTASTAPAASLSDPGAPGLWLHFGLLSFSSLWFQGCLGPGRLLL